MKNEVRRRIKTMAEEEYRQFSAKLLPGTDDILGVRLPLLRALAKEIADGDWRAYLTAEKDLYFEETMLRGMVIGYANMDIDARLNWIAAFVPCIGNWSVCDSFCGGLKFTRREQARVWAFLDPYFHSAHAFSVRFAVVMLLGYFIDEAYIGRVLQKLAEVQHDDYYVKMAVAWALSVAYARFPERALVLLKQGGLDGFTHNKAIAKITESRVVTEADKNLARAMRRGGNHRRGRVVT